jgi:site-specific DNA recombinase
MQAAIYARFSTDQQREASIEDQIRACERIAAVNNLSIFARYDDRGISGGTSEREGYQSLLTAARAAEFGVIICEDISRLWRNRSEYGQRSAELEDLGVHLVTAVGDDTRRDGYMVLTIKSAIAEAQRREIGYRTRRGLEGLALAGKSTGGRCYGFQGATIAPEEASWVRFIFDRRLAGLSFGRIAAELTAAGVEPVGGGPWSRFSVRTILNNRARYQGAVVWGRTETKGGARDSRQRKKVIRAEPIVSRHDPSRNVLTPGAMGVY